MGWFGPSVGDCSCCSGPTTCVGLPCVGIWDGFKWAVEVCTPLEDDVEGCPCIILGTGTTIGEEREGTCGQPLT